MKIPHCLDSILSVIFTTIFSASIVFMFIGLIYIATLDPSQINQDILDGVIKQLLIIAPMM